MGRLPPLAESDLDETQRAVLEEIRRGPRGDTELAGPFGLYVRAPRVGGAAQQLGAAVRFDTGLAANVREVAICTVGAHFRSGFEFAMHSNLAIDAGVDAAILDALRSGRKPDFDDACEQAAYEVATALLRRHFIDEATFESARELLGETQLIELVIATGYYCLVSLALNAFEVPPPAGMTDPFPRS